MAFVKNLIAGLLGAALSMSQATALDYPKRFITIVLPVAVGGGTDTVVRVVADKLSAGFSQQIVVENRPGAGGNVAGEAVARAQPDGYTLLAVTASHATNPSLYAHMSYDPFTDLVPITQLTTQPYLLVVPTELPAKNLREFVEYAKRKSGGIVYASSGAGLLGHLGMEMLKTQAGFQAVHVPYRGANQALMDTIAGRVDAFFPTIVSGGPQVTAGTLRALAVTGAQRSPLMPDVPTVAEQGYPEFEVSGWYGIVAPKGTPQEIRAFLSSEIKKVLALRDVKDRINNDGATPAGSTPEEFAQFIESERKKWAEVIRTSGAKVD